MSDNPMDHQKITLTDEQMDKARRLQEGGVMTAYRIDGQIKMETEEGIEPYIWRPYQEAKDGNPAIDAHWEREQW